ncbi:DNA ligase 1 [Exaiptasia diaphana]|uniref:Uncharacterized protein n=1 Tax=Exaiptasia diaphana TaxID=2652724 RepID=A0A913X960_EXADI|nr:DNA ligase 1 [Exaiptasia diaphana]KXJ26706.1 hypothetical protein AC249_AIPGENE9285 [Exaiptasia diaphana]
MSSTALANLSEEQIKALLTILNEKTKIDSSSESTTSTATSTVASTSEVDDGPKKKEFTASELLQKKKKNTKSTEAQETFLYTVRESAKQVGLWEKAPSLNSIPFATFTSFMEKVITALPQLAGYEHRIRERLSLTLMNRRSQLKNVLNWKRTAKLQKWQNALKARKNETPLQLPSSSQKTVKPIDVVKKRLVLESLVCSNKTESDNKKKPKEKTIQVNRPDKKGNEEIESKENKRDEEENEENENKEVESDEEMRMDEEMEEDMEEEEDDFSFSPGDQLYIMDGAKKLARASFIKKSKLDDELAIVTVQSIYKDGKDIKVKDVKRQERLLGSLKPGDRFLYKQNQMLSSLEMQKVHPNKQKKLDKLMEKQTGKTKEHKTNDTCKQQVPAKGWKGYVLGEALAKNKFGPPTHQKRERKPKKATDDYILL